MNWPIIWDVTTTVQPPAVEGRNYFGKTPDQVLPLSWSIGSWRPHGRSERADPFRQHQVDDIRYPRQQRRRRVNGDRQGSDSSEVQSNHHVWLAPRQNDWRPAIHSERNGEFRLAGQLQCLLRTSHDLRQHARAYGTGPCHSGCLTSRQREL